MRSTNEPWKVWVAGRRLVPSQFPLYPTTFFFFEALPPEIQLAILRYCIPTKRVITARTHFEKDGPLVDYYSISKHLSTLVKRLYHSENIFKIERSKLSLLGASIVHLPRPAMGNYLRRIHLNIQLSGKFASHEELLKHDDPTDSTKKGASDLVTLVHRHERDDSSASSGGVGDDNPFASHDTSPRETCELYATQQRLCRWQKSLSELQEARIVVELETCLDEQQRTILEDLPNWATSCLRAKRVVVTTSAMGCQHGIENGDAGCQSVVQRVFNQISGTMLR
jgi:hypothetical protein